MGCGASNAVSAVDGPSKGKKVDNQKSVIG